MEDKSDFKDGLESEPSTGIWGIYDGHLGSGMASLVKQELIIQFERILVEEYKGAKELTQEFFNRVFAVVNGMADQTIIP